MTDLTAITAAVQEDAADAVDFLEAFVNMESPTEDKDLCDAVARLLAASASDLEMEVHLDPLEDYGDTVVAHLKADAPTARVLCVGHYDTVFARGTVAERPFTVDGEVARGPGVLDMKAGITAGLFAIRALQRLGVSPTVDVSFIFNGDEEPGSPVSRELIEREAPAYDLAFILEPSDTPGTVTTRRKGVGIIALEHHGVASHAGAEPEAGVNAIVDAAERIAAVWALQDRAAGTTLNPGVISGGTKPYVVPAHARLEIDARVSTLAEQRRVEDGLADIAAMTTSIDGAKAVLHGGFHRPPMEPTELTDHYLGQVQQVAQAFGRPLTAAASGAASDGNNTASLGVPTIDGMGAEGFGAHGLDEYIDLPTLHQKTELLAALLTSLRTPEHA